MMHIGKGGRGIRQMLMTGVAAIGAAMCGENFVAAALLVYEPFDYPAGTILDGTPTNGTNLTGSYTALGSLAAQKVAVSSPGLNYGNLTNVPPAAGNRANDLLGVTSSGATISVDADVEIPSGAAIYFSALFTFDDSENGNRFANIVLRDDANGDELSFGEAAVGVRAIRITADTVATGGLVANGADGAFANGSTLLLLGRYLNRASGADLLELIGYDTADADQLPAGFDAGDPNAEFAYSIDDREINFERISSITFLIRGDDNNFVDELRIGTTYGDIVPESSSIAMVICGATMAWEFVRRRTRMPSTP